MSTSSAGSILHRLRSHSFKFYNRMTLGDENDKNASFCGWFVELFKTRLTLCEDIIFSNEAAFRLQIIVKTALGA